jgi:tRNA-dihydrouridine synthase 1
MVGGSELAFRLLCRRYGCDLAYTPMISSDRFINDSTYEG